MPTYEYRCGSCGEVFEHHESAADRLAQGRADVYLIDEIGKMECLSDRFVSQMRTLLDGPRPVIATVGQHGSGFIEEVKRAKGIVLWDVSYANRDKLAVEVLQWLSEDGRGD